MQLGHIGAFDFDNYGDLLFAEVLQYAIRKRLPNAEIRHFSPRGAKFQVVEKFQSHPISELARHKDLSALVIGGGDVVQTNIMALWKLYGMDIRFPQLPYRLSRMANQILDRFHRLGSRSNQPLLDMWESRFHYRSYAPFIPDKSFPLNDCKLMFNAVGVGTISKDSERECYSAVARSFNDADYVSVRDNFSSRQLEMIGVTQDVSIVPDTALMIGQIHPKAGIVESGRQLLAKHGVNPSQPVICLHASPPDRDLKADYIRAIRKFAAAKGASIVLLPIRSWAQDLWRMQEFVKEIPEAKLIPQYLPAGSIIAVFAASNYAITAGLHSLVTAVAYNVRVQALPTQATKIVGFLDQLQLSHLMIPSDTDLFDRLSDFDWIDLEDLSAKRCGALERIDRHYDRMADLIS